MLVVKETKELILKFNSRQQKDLLSKYVAIFKTSLQKRWDVKNSKDAIL
jgi:hypothetical protein